MEHRGKQQERATRTMETTAATAQQTQDNNQNADMDPQHQPTLPTQLYPNVGLAEDDGEDGDGDAGDGDDAPCDVADDGGNDEYADDGHDDNKHNMRT